GPRGRGAAGDVRRDRARDGSATGTADAGRRGAARRGQGLRAPGEGPGNLADRGGKGRRIAGEKGRGAGGAEGGGSRARPGGASAEAGGAPRRPAPGRGCAGGGRGGGGPPMNLVIQAALRMRWFVLLLTLGVLALGVWAYQHQSIDAYPDISAQMVQIITVYPGRAPEEVERQVTIPVENAMLGLPHVETVRSRTIFGLSVVQMIFEEGTEAYWARQRVTEK